MLFLTDSSDWWMHSVMAPVVSIDVINLGAGEEVHLPAGRAGDKVGHSNTRAGKDGNLAAVEADGAGHGPGALIASVKLADVQPRT